MRFERGDDDVRVRVEREVAGRDAGVPSARLPLGELVICERTGRNRENSLPFEFRLDGFKNKRLPGTGRRVDDDVPSRAEMLHGFALPQVGHGELLKQWIHLEWTQGAGCRMLPPVIGMNVQLSITAAS